MCVHSLEQIVNAIAATLPPLSIPVAVLNQKQNTQQMLYNAHLHMRINKFNRKIMYTNLQNEQISIEKKCECPAHITTK